MTSEADDAVLDGPPTATALGFGNGATSGSGVALVRPTTTTKVARSRRASLGLRVIVPVAAVGIWGLLTGSGIVAPTVLSSPSATWSTFWDLLVHHDLLGDIGISLARAAA